MEENKIMLLSQLGNNLGECFALLKRAYQDEDKERFDYSKKSLLEIQRKVDFLLKNTR